ncbi:MAG: PEP-CTERM sorting domain-containing protein [Pirellulales bacterium]
MRCFLSVLIFTGMALPAAAATIDGSLDAEYGAALAVQAVQTSFGDANPPGNLGGSELDAAYATVSGGRLNLLLTGNLEPNFNKLEVFIDSKPGGENTLSGTPQYDFFNGSIWISQNLQGLTFDNPFAADYHLFARWGGGPGPFEVDFIDRQGGGNASVPGSSEAGAATVGLISAGTIPAGDVGPNASGSALSQPLHFAINDNNAAGVTGGTGAANAVAALAVSTGMEFSIDLADLGNPGIGDVILIAAMVNNGDHNYLSNQLLGSLVPDPLEDPPLTQENLGGNGEGGFIGNLSGVDLNDFAGLQFFSVTVIPEPSTLGLTALAGLGLLGAIVRRSRR